MKKTLLILLVVIFLSAGCSLTNPPANQIDNADQTSDIDQTKIMEVNGIMHNLDFEKALAESNNLELEKQLNYKVNLLRDATECCGCTVRQGIVKSLGNFQGIVFDDNNQTVNKIRAKYKSWENNPIGITDNEVVLTYTMTEENKINEIFVSAVPILYLDDPKVYEKSTLPSLCEKGAFMKFDEFESATSLLNSVDNYTGEGFSSRGWDTQSFKHSISAELPDPAPDKFYEGWLVKTTGGFDFFSTGKLEKNGDYYELNYSRDNYPKEYTQVVVTEETLADGLDNKPEAHVLEGEFENQ